MAHREKKHVCMVVYSRYVIDNRVRREAETLVESDEYEVTVLVPKEGPVSRRYRLNGVNVRELNVQRYRGKRIAVYVISYLKFLSAAFLVVSGLRLQNKTDVVHIHNMPNFLVFSAMIPRLSEKKVILDIHDSVPETYVAKFGTNSSFIFKLFSFEEALCCRFAQNIICVNHPQRDVLVKRGIPADKIFVSMNVPHRRWFGVDLQNENETQQADDFNLVYHGTLAKRLGIDLTIHALAKLIDKIPNLKFHVYGEGDDLDEFVALRDQLGLQNHVNFNPSRPLESLLPALRRMHLGIISNRRNMATELMLPVKMLEYVSLNIPVIAPRLNTIQYYFKEDMVTYFEPENIDSLSAAILDAYNNNEKRVRQAEEAHKFLHAYGWDIHKHDLINLYRSLTS